jgi:uncharacterized protein YlzI (FlbEa/FlbD family)
MSWVSCTDESGRPIYVNLALAVQVKAQGNSSVIHFVDGKDVIVRERPEDIVPFTTIPTA